MAFPATHILLPMFIVEIYRRYFAKKRFSRWYVFLAGLIGASPDFDFLYALAVKGAFDSSYHRNVTHTLWLPMATLVAGLVIYFLYSRKVLKYDGWKVSYYVLFIATVGLTLHVVLDGLDGFVQWFYPLDWSVVLPGLLVNDNVAGMLDGILLLSWLLFDEELLSDILRFFRIKS